MARWRSWGVLALLPSLLLAACVQVPSPAERRAQADALAAQHGWERLALPAGDFELFGYAPARIRTGEELTVYIEGDGFAWASSIRPSRDPTPRSPLALQLALAQPAGHAVYLARPCQYADAQARDCSMRYWTDARFAEEVIAATDRALDALKARFAAQRLVLVGYSGGGAVAGLVAARRADVRLLVTMAGNLDHRAWAQLHRLTPLAGSLNPADYRAALGPIRQCHLSGAQDAVMPASIARDFIAGLPASGRAQLLVVPDYDHHCCWVRDWPALWLKVSVP